MHRQHLAPELGRRTNLLSVGQVAKAVINMHFSRLINRVRHLRQRQRLSRFY